MRTEAHQRIRSTKQVSKLSLGQNKHGRNITTPGEAVDEGVSKDIYNFSTNIYFLNNPTFINAIEIRGNGRNFFLYLIQNLKLDSHIKPSKWIAVIVRMN